jgi:fatty acid desaturase
MTADYAELRRIVLDAGLMSRQPGYYVGKFLSTGLLLAFGLLVLVQGPRLPAWVHLLNAVYLAFVFGQLGLLGHDVAHLQILANQRVVTPVGLLLGNVLLGIGLSWWRYSHGTHHNHPNHVELDPAVDFSMLAFTPEQGRQRPQWSRWFIRRQAKLVSLLACLELVNLRAESIAYVLSRRPRSPRYSALEGMLLFGHIALYVGLILMYLGPGLGASFLVVHHALAGLYLTSLFAPNHKGMPMQDGLEPLDFIHEQVLTARNIQGGPLTDFWYGGLNYQIEHHLFPTMARNRLSRAVPLVRAYCLSHGLTYHVTSLAGAYAEVFRDFQRVSDVLAAEKPRPSSALRV